MRLSQVSLTVCVLGLLILAGCSNVNPLEVKISPVKQVPLVLPEIDPFKLDPVEWFVVNKDNAEAVFAELEKKGYDQVIFGLTDKGYENMTVNMAKILAMVRQQEAIIGAYKKHHDRQKETIDSHNKEQQKQEEARKKAKDVGSKGFVRVLRFWDLGK